MAATGNGKTTFDLGLGLESTHILITGGAGLIGRVVVEAFQAAGSKVSVLDIAASHNFDTDSSTLSYHQCDISDSGAVATAFQQAEAAFGPVECCVALASLDLSVLQQSESLADMDPAEWRRVLDVNVNGTFNTCQQWLRCIRRAVSSGERASALRNVGLIIVGSVSGRFGERTMAAYSAGKSAVQCVASDHGSPSPFRRIANRRTAGTASSPAWHKTRRASTTKHASTPSRPERWTRRDTARRGGDLETSFTGRSARRRELCMRDHTLSAPLMRRQHAAGESRADRGCGAEHSVSGE